MNILLGRRASFRDGALATFKLALLAIGLEVSTSMAAAV